MLKINISKLLGLLMIMVMIFSLTACDNGRINTNKGFDKKSVVTNNLKNAQVLAENEQYSMEWVAESCSVALIEKATGYKTLMCPLKKDEPEFDSLGMPTKKNSQTQSAIFIEYIDVKNSENRMISYNGAVKDGRISTEVIDNGVKVYYYFDDAEIMVPVEYTLRKDSIKISVNPKEIQENENKITAVSVAPFMCSVENDLENSYLFYPSGSGTLIDNKTLSQAGRSYDAQVYGNDPVMQIDYQENTDKSIRIPVYGSKAMDQGVCAIIEEGAETTTIRADVGSSSIGFTAAYTRVQLRGYSSNTATFIYGLKQTMNVYSTNMIDTMVSIGFYPLKGEDANYSGMAKTYKNFLGLKGEKTDDEAVLSLTFVGGTVVDKSFLGIPYEGVIAATTFNDVKKILEELSTEVDGKINVRLVGFGETGITSRDYAGGFNFNKKFGTLSELKELNKYCESNNIDLFFDFDLTTLKNSSSGFSNVFDVSYSALGKIAYIYDYDVATRSKIDSTKHNLLKRELLEEGANKLLKKISKWNLDGISLSTLSNVCYSDFSTKDNVNYHSKANSSLQISGILEKAAKDYKLASSDANAYSAVLSTVIYDVPTSSSQEKVFSKDVPFYQMVFKGYVDLTGDYQNLSSVPKANILKHIETGNSLSYLTISNYDSVFVNYEGYEFFNSEYADISDEIISNYKNTKDYFSKVNGAEIVSHTILENGLNETKFDNGVTVYVNYTDERIENVDALGYVWRDEHGK